MFDPNHEFLRISVVNVTVMLLGFVAYMLFGSDELTPEAGPWQAFLESGAWMIVAAPLAAGPGYWLGHRFATRRRQKGSV